MRNSTTEEKEKAKEYLRKLFQPTIDKGECPVLYTSLRHVSRSGMMRHVDVYFIEDNKPVWLNGYIEIVSSFKRAKSASAPHADSLRVGGCGMDVGFEIVYTLSNILYRDNFLCVGENCHSNDHVNGDPEGRKKGHKHTDAGYFLQQRWL